MFISGKIVIAPVEHVVRYKIDYVKRGNVMQSHDIVSLKSTGEYVTVLSMNPEEFQKFGMLDDHQYGTVLVRRPRLTQNGIDHVLSLFFEYELESVEDHVKREVNDAMLKLAAQKEVMDAKVKALEAMEPDGNVAPKTYFN